MTDPMQQVAYLQQSLSSDKRPVGLFLGAGCPMGIRSENNEPLIPDISGITRSVCSYLEECESFGIVREYFRENGQEAPTVEDYLTYIRSLAAVAGNGNVRGLSAEQLDKLDEVICDQIHKIVDKDLPEIGTPYHELASWVRAVEREYPVEVFTTNYDLLTEQAFEKLSVPYFDGFAGALQPSFDLQAIEEDQLPCRWARLWKLHGSINWLLTGGKVFRGLGNGERRVIHPSHLKYHESRRMPYLAMMDRLRRFLRNDSAVLFICGFSFRDEHINEVIVQGLQSTGTTAAFGLLYGKIGDYEDAINLAKGQPNLTLLARDGAVIGSQELAWSTREALPVDSDWANWNSTCPGSDKEEFRADFVLGDFVVFGKFLQSIVGSTQRILEQSNAE